MSAPRNIAYVGTYTRSGRSEGIHVFHHDLVTGVLTPRASFAARDPTFLAFDPAHRFLFAVTEGRGRDEGGVASFEINPDSGDLVWISTQPTGGGEPCHLCVDPSGRWLLVANHEHGTVAVFPVDQNGRLGPMSDFRQHSGSGPGATQQGPHAHHVTFDPRGRRVLVTDKGIDQVVIYQLDDRTGTLEPNDPPFGRVHPGAAPRHLAFGPTGRFAYVNGEADMTLSVFSYDAETGAMHELQALSTLPMATAATDGYSTAEVQVDPNGRFVYVSNRGHDSLACFAIDQATGVISPLGHVSTLGRTPRHFTIDPSGRRLYVANQESDTVVQFDLDVQTGQLTPTGAVTEVGAPACILFS